MKIKEQTRKLAAGCSKHCFEVVDRTDEVSNHTYGKATLTWFEFDFRRVLENTDERLHTEASQDDGNPAEGTKKNGFTAGFDHGDEVGFETDSAHGHDDEEFRQLFERCEEATTDTEGSKDGG